MLQTDLLLSCDGLIILHYRPVRCRECVESVDNISGNGSSEALDETEFLGNFPTLQIRGQQV